MRNLIFLFCISILFSCQQNNKPAAKSVDWLSLESKTTTNSQNQVTARGATDEKGRRQGLWVEFHPRKNLVKSMHFYVDGKKNGPYLIANETNNISERGSFINDVLEGEHVVYNRSRIKEDNFFKNGQLDGARKKFYDNGKIMEEGNFVNGNREGIATWYNQDEEITFQYEYKNGEKIREVPVEKSTEKE